MGESDFLKLRLFRNSFDVVYSRPFKTDQIPDKNFYALGVI